MKRRGLFSFLAAAPVGAVGVANAASQKKHLPNDVCTISISQPKNTRTTHDIGGMSIKIYDSEPHG